MEMVLGFWTRIRCFVFVCPPENGFPNLVVAAGWLAVRFGWLVGGYLFDMLV